MVANSGSRKVLEEVLCASVAQYGLAIESESPTERYFPQLVSWHRTACQKRLAEEEAVQAQRHPSKNMTACMVQVS